METAIEVRNLYKVYDRKNKAPLIANSNVNFEVGKGEIFGLIGANGAGKTTLLSQIMGLTTPSGGNLTVENIDVARYPERVKEITGYLPQTGQAMRYLEVERALSYTGQLRGQPANNARWQARSLIEELEMSNYAKRYVNKLSGGMLRLVNFAMALMGEPRLLILDEPTNEFDPNLRQKFWNKITRLNREQGVTCLLVTHNLLEAEKLINRVGIMQHGKLLKVSTPGALKQDFEKKLYLDFSFKNDQIKVTDIIRSYLSCFGQLNEASNGHYQLQLPEETAPKATEFLLATFGLSVFEHFRLAQPSLESLYLQQYAGSQDELKGAKSE